MHAPIVKIPGNQLYPPCVGTPSADEHVASVQLKTPLCILLTGCLSQLDVARFAKKYPAVMTALLRSILEVTVKYYKALLG